MLQLPKTSRQDGLLIFCHSVKLFCVVTDMCSYSTRCF